jgi:hypothetical protein
VASKDVCGKLGDLTQLAVNRYHPTSAPPIDFIDSFRDGSGKALTDSTSLKAASPCMEDVRSMCTKKTMGTLPFGFSSYRAPTEIDPKTNQFKYALSAADGGTGGRTGLIHKAYDEYVKSAKAAGTTPMSEATFFALGRESLKYMDTCMASSLQYRYGINDLASAGKVSMGGTTGDLFQGTALLYKDCRPVEPWKQQIVNGAKCAVAIAASFYEYTTPISLLWSSEVNIREIASRSKFPLNPDERGKWFVWRGSGLTPLIVWDPKRSGEIVSAEQLFGAHTWGKKWKHGYEPLGSLDMDGNGWLEGDELKDLVLWFDFNQDGISDKGEVKELKDVGVTALGVTVTSSDEKNGEVHAAKGFKRTVNGAVIEGASVDWFSGSEDGRFGMEALDESAVLAAANIDKVMNASATFDPLDEVSGMWDWRVVDKNAVELPENMPHGTLVLYSTNKEVGGTIYVAHQFAPNKSGIGERVSYRPIKGSAHAGEKGQPRVTFSATNQAGGAVESVAQLSEDGMYLAGVTTEHQGEGKEPLKYAWVARRADPLR